MAKSLSLKIVMLLALVQGITGLLRGFNLYGVNSAQLAAIV
jgi:hypothetical protein